MITVRNVSYAADTNVDGNCATGFTAQIGRTHLLTCTDASVGRYVVFTTTSAIYLTEVQIFGGNVYFKTTLVYEYTYLFMSELACKRFNK